MNTARRVGAAVFTFFGSFGLSVAILLFLLVLTFFGTLEQVDSSLYDVQKRYFESLFVVARVGSMPLPLPGAYLLLSGLFVNLILGGMIRLRRTRSKLGVFVVHVGIALLLLGGLVEFQSSKKGRITLYEGDRADYFQSWFEWDVAVTERHPDQSSTEFVIPEEAFEGSAEDNIRRAAAADLPFDIAFTQFFANCRPVLVPLQGDGSERGIDGYELSERPREKAAEADVAGLQVALLERGGRAAIAPRALLFGLQREPWKVEVEGRVFEVDLRKARYELPFEIELRDFTRELHPGTGMPSKFYSDVTVMQGGTERDLTIRMNEPLRQDGYTLYQASWGPSTAGPNDRLFSTFAVVRNPADRWPLYACIVISLGLLMHFMPRLARHIRVQEKRSCA